MKKLMQLHDRAHRTMEGKMKKLADFSMPLKMFASAIFTGFIILYMISGVAYATITGDDFVYAVPFVFILQGLLLSALISLLWGILFSDILIKSWRCSPRLILFSISLAVLLAVCVLTFVAIPTDWAALWLITNGAVCFGLIVFSIVNEMRLRATGRRYTEILKNFQAEN